MTSNNHIEREILQKEIQWNNLSTYCKFNSKKKKYFDIINKFYTLLNKNVWDSIYVRNRIW